MSVIYLGKFLFPDIFNTVSKLALLKELSNSTKYKNTGSQILSGSEVFTAVGVKSIIFWDM
jgi:hypothetical protein